MAGKRDAWLEQRLGYLAGEQARLKAGPPLRRFQAVSARLDQFEHRADRAEVAGAAPNGPDPGPSLAAGLTQQPP
jgi:hypothetical protein